MKRASLFIRLLNAALLVCFVLVMTFDSGLTNGERAALEALNWLGTPYKLGTSGTDQFDCSGLIRYCFRKEGIEFPHSADEIGADERFAYIGHIDDLIPGDIVSFDTVRDKDPSDHVGIYLGNGLFVHASSAKHEVTVSELAGYYTEKFTGARRTASPFYR